MNELAHNLGALIRSARTSAKLSKADVSRLTGIAQSRLCRYESGNIQPDATTLSLLVLNLNLPKSVVDAYAFRRIRREKREGVVL